MFLINNYLHLTLFDFVSSYNLLCVIILNTLLSYVFHLTVQEKIN